MLHVIDGFVVWGWEWGVSTRVNRDKEGFSCSVLYTNTNGSFCQLEDVVSPQYAVQTTMQPNLKQYAVRQQAQ